ncbi:type F conjugative transfer system protein TrbI [Pseudoduganella lurida]|uniref:Type F conjugative transfer system protein TrbI n=1 Tax=Pseudoduganella lurida TaxID=1036180 RepID=A0A562RK41_9BURK|nr:TrbI F-type domain-containing protein [Pseudoduganella lurida]TWI69293.1 type F conjugative transfer system protein TrbI [Pseudoduganella lurida]
MKPFQNANRAAVAALLVGAALTVVILIVELAHVPPKPPRIAQVDLTRILREYQHDTAAMLARLPNDGDTTARALARTAAFGQRLDEAARRLSTQCGCVLLMREAVVAGQMPDLTPRLIELMSQQ